MQKYDWATIFRKRIELELKKSREGQRYDPEWYKSELDRSREIWGNITVTIILCLPLLLLFCYGLTD